MLDEVSNFFQHLGHEHLQEIKSSENNLEKHKVVEFDLPATGLFRLAIESSGGYVGSLVPRNCEEIIIMHSEAKIRYKPRKFP